MERKRSDDIVSLDSWNEAISTPESESPKSPADAFMSIMEEANGGKTYGKKRSAARRNHRSRSHSDRDRNQVKQTNALILSPSKFLDQNNTTSSTETSTGAFESRDPDVFQDTLIERDTLNGASAKTKRENEFGKKVSEQSRLSSVISNEDNRQAKIVQGWVGEVKEDGSQNTCQRHRYQKHKHHQQSYDRCQQQQSGSGKPKVMSQSWQTQPHQYHPQHHPRHYHHSRQNQWMGHERLNNVLQYPSTATYPPSARNTSHSSQNDEDIDQSEKMKNKILSVWNNVRYGWTLKTKTNFKCDSPIFLLGQCYHIRPSDDNPLPGEKICMVPTVEKFKQDFSSQLWFTYRQDFPAIAGTKLTSDCGWGCMLRSGQMMVARAFVNHFLGRDWNVFRDQSVGEETFRKQIIRWFGDFPSEQSPFSIHHLVEIGKKLGKDPGDWYGPSSVAHILRDAMLRGYSAQPVLANICLYVAQDSTVYKQDIYDMCCKRSRSVTHLTSSTESETEGAKNKSPSEEEDEWKRAVIILVPIRLGSEEMNPVYGPCIKSLLAQDNCIGVIGGKPKHSLYFIGFQDDKLIYLDPHYCQDAVDTRERNFPVQSYHCLSPRKVALSKMDPSCTVGFYCKTKKEFETFVSQSEAMVSPPKQKLSYPMFVFSDGRGSELTLDSLNLEEDKLLRIRHVKTDQYGRVRSSTVDSEEFVVLYKPVEIVRNNKLITENLIRKRAEHNNLEISTLEEVSLHQQDIEKIEYIDKWCKELKILYLQSNLIPKIENVSKLKKLEYLNLALNNVERVENLEGCESLQKLDLTVNFVGEVTSIECLKDLVHFNELYLTGNPCAQFEGYRQYVIATLPRLKRLDGIEVEKSERILASQEYGEVRAEIIRQQKQYKKKREKEKREAKLKDEQEKNEKEQQEEKKEEKPGFDGRWYTDINESDKKLSQEEKKEAGEKKKKEFLEKEKDEDQKEKEYWETPSAYTPESRLEVHNHLKEQRERKDGPKEKPKPPRRLFMDDGRPLNVNEAKVEFSLIDDEENNCYVLDIAVFKHMDTSLIDADVQTNYVRITLKGKIFQLCLDEDVNADSSTAKRSQITGHLLVTMPKAKPLLTASKPKSVQEKNKENKENKKTEKQNTGKTKEEKLEVDASVHKTVDIAGIMENSKKTVPPLGSNIRRPVKERPNSDDFVDDPDVPPLM
ncbi:uncharacterized protein LOC132550333 [Ylistrum balloti]|uniref:uncharacterized protein LOC132550333 n=1 Tax=Ylistrum balloti TaxID=509963 RepID=UPI0029059652|nr:uncharacterized protein LOC132550333 [Ylistrum balloti]